MQSEWRWFGGTLRDSWLRPRHFASTLGREHYGLAGILVVLVSGIALSIAIDAAVLLSKGFNPLAADPTRLVLDAIFLGLRLAVVVSLVALLTVGAARLSRLRLDLDQAFTALSFATGMLLFAPLAIVPQALSSARPDMRAPLLALTLVVSLALVARFAAAIALNLAGVVGRAAILVGAVALVAMGVVLSDQLGRVLFTTLSYAPDVLPPPAAVAGGGRGVSIEGASFSVPVQWRDAQQGAPGVIADLELPDARLIVHMSTVPTLTTADAFASAEVQKSLRGFDRVDRTERGVVRIDRAVALDDRWYGELRGSRLVERQYAFVVGVRGYVFEFTFYAPADEDAAMAQAAAIAASIRLAP
ncbi:MAG: hypothetical protein E6I87_08985 [Chloroflexi bacterium]|nr:MAG: hypothetical protein E6I87_08985 [Chloroflexota bacterium]